MILMDTITSDGIIPTGTIGAMILSMIISMILFTAMDILGIVVGTIPGIHLLSLGTMDIMGIIDTMVTPITPLITVFLP